MKNILRVSSSANQFLKTLKPARNFSVMNLNDKEGKKEKEIYQNLVREDIDHDPRGNELFISEEFKAEFDKRFDNNPKQNPNTSVALTSDEIVKIFKEVKGNNKFK